MAVIRSSSYCEYGERTQTNYAQNGYQGQSMSCIRLNRAGKNMTDLMCMRLRFSSDGPSGHSNVAGVGPGAPWTAARLIGIAEDIGAPKNRWLAKLVATSNSCSFADRAEAWLPSKRLQMRGGINRESTIPIRPPLTSSKTLATPYSTRSPRPKPAEQTLPHHRCALHASEHGSACRKKPWRWNRRGAVAQGAWLHRLKEQVGHRARRGTQRRGGAANSR